MIIYNKYSHLSLLRTFILRAFTHMGVNLLTMGGQLEGAE